MTGAVDELHPLRDLLSHDVDDSELAWFCENAVQPDVMGVNYYPRHSTELFEPGATIYADGVPATVAGRKRSGGRLVIRLDPPRPVVVTKPVELIVATDCVADDQVVVVGEVSTTSFVAS